jgi:hypothetical protein
MKIESDRHAKTETDSRPTYHRKSRRNLSHLAHFNQGGPNVVDRSADPPELLAFATSSAMT